MPGSVQMVDVRLAQAADLELAEQVEQVLAVQVVEPRPGPLALAHLFHRRLVARAASESAKRCQSFSNALRPQESFRLARDAVAPVHDGTEHVEGQRPYVGDRHRPSHGIGGQGPQGMPVSSAERSGQKAAAGPPAVLDQTRAPRWRRARRRDCKLAPVSRCTRYETCRRASSTPPSSATCSAPRRCAGSSPTRTSCRNISIRRWRSRGCRRGSASSRNAAADEITANADAGRLDLDQIRRETEIVGYPIVRAGASDRRSSARATPAATPIGARPPRTSWTPRLVLQIRDGAGADRRRSGGDRAPALADLARQHRDTVMAGRTHLQHALPVTFGYKVAVWLSPLARHRERLEQLRPRLLVGSSAAPPARSPRSATRGWRCSDALARRTRPRPPPASPGTSRATASPRRSASSACSPAALAKIATDVILMMQTEVAGGWPSRSSRAAAAASTMPQKRNPISCELIIAAGRGVRRMPPLMLDAMAADHERATGPWQVEWLALPEAFVLTAGALHQARFMLEGLEVDPGAHAAQPRHDRRPDRGRGGDDGPRAGARPRPRRMTSSTTPAASRRPNAARCWTCCGRRRK